MEKIKCILFLLCIYAHVSYAQITVENCPSQVVGYTIYDREIQGKCYTLGERIQSMEVDDSRNYLLVKTRPVTRKGKKLSHRGKMVILDLHTREILWFKTFDYREDREILLPQGILWIHHARECALLDWQTGETIWDAREDPFVADLKNNVLLSYHRMVTGGITDNLGAIDIATGKVIWETKISHDFGWNMEYMLNDSVRLVVSDGLHLINMRDGSGYSYPARTGNEDFREAALTGALGTIAGILTGTFFIPTGGNLITDLVSDVISEDSVYFMADREKLVSLDSVLDPVWEYTLPRKEASRSVLFIRENRLYMLNLGFGCLRAYLAGGPVRKKVDIGSPFIASFDKTTGNKIYLTHFGSNDNPLKDFAIKEHVIYLLFQKGISCHRLSDTRGVDMILWNEEKYGIPEGFVDRTVFTYDAVSGKYEEIIPADGHALLYNENADIFEVDSQLRVIRSFSSGNKYFLRFTWENLRLIENKEASYLINHSGILQGTLHRSPVYGTQNILFSVDKEKMRIIQFDLDEFSPATQQKATTGNQSSF